MFRVPLRQLRSFLGGPANTASNVDPAAAGVSSSITMLGENTSMFNPEVLNMIMQNCSPHDLAVLRRVCRAFKTHLDEEPALWQSARMSVAEAPAPAAFYLSSAVEDGEEVDNSYEEGEITRLNEAEWAIHLFTGALEHKRGGKSIPEWVKRYGDEWHKSQEINIGSLSEFVREKEGLGVESRKKRVRELMRTPACLRMFRAFRRDLETPDYATFAREYPLFVDQAARARTGDLSMLPQGYQLHARDKIACPQCDGAPEEQRTYIIKDRKIVYTFNGKPVRSWKDPKKYVVSNGLKDHYTAKHKAVPFPWVQLMEPCSACRVPNPKLYCAQGMIAHQYKSHGPINPKWCP
ncbi:hypothetical protein HDZ31DRAFT_40092 [Schizophyllum fasciatum]